MHRLTAIVVALVLNMWLPVAAAQDAAAPGTPAIVTTGEAVVRRAPDQAFVTVSVESRARNPRDAQRQNAEAMTLVQQRIAASGIPKDAVRTIGYTIQQEFDYVENRRIARGYLAHNALEVRVDNVDRTGEILDVAVQAGATSVASVRFDLKDRSGAEREALRLAVVDARARAEAAAAGVGRAVDRVLRIEDMPQGQGGPPHPMMAMAREADRSQTPIEAGELEIRARVLLTVSIK